MCIILYFGIVVALILLTIFIDWISNAITDDRQEREPNDDQGLE